MINNTNNSPCGQVSPAMTYAKNKAKGALGNDSLIQKYIHSYYEDLNTLTTLTKDMSTLEIAVQSGIPFKLEKGSSYEFMRKPLSFVQLLIGDYAKKDEAALNNMATELKLDRQNLDKLYTKVLDSMGEKARTIIEDHFKYFHLVNDSK